jgi:hypothetical protein
MTRSKQHHQSMTTHFEALEKRELMSASPLRTPVPHVARPMIHAVEATLHAVKAAAGAGTGLTAEYFADAGMTAGNVIRTDPSINFVPAVQLGRVAEK